MKYLAAFILLSVLSTSCRKENIAYSTPDYFNFGTAYGMCAGNCTFFFSLRGGNVYADNVSYFHPAITYHNTPLPHADYLLAKQALDSFPSYLSNHPDETFGHPDSHDQGLIYIEQRINNQTHHWYIDTEVDSLPSEIRSYAALVMSIISQL